MFKNSTKFFCALFVMTLSCISSMAATKIYFENLTIKAGDTQTIGLILENDVNVQSLTYTFTLPEGLSLVKAERVNARLDREEHEFYCDQQGSTTQTYKISVMSVNGMNIEGNSGAIAKITVKAATDYDGTGEIKVQATKLASDVMDANGNQLEIENVVAPNTVVNQLTGMLVVAPETINFTTDNNKATVNVGLDSNLEVYGLQFDVVVPEGITFATKTNGNVKFTYTDRMAGNLAVRSNLNGNTLTIVINDGETCFTGNSGELFSFEVEGDLDALASASDAAIKFVGVNISDVTGKQSSKINEPAIAINSPYAALFAAAIKDMEKLEALQAELSAAIAGNEEYIVADNTQAIETLLGDAYPTMIMGAYEEAKANGQYVSPIDWEHLRELVDGIINEINNIKTGVTPLYTEFGVVASGADIDTNIPFFNTPVMVDVYATDKVVIKGWDGVEGSDLTIAYTKIAQNDEEPVVAILGIEQTVNGEVVSEFVEDDDDPANSMVTLIPQGGKYVAAAIYPFHEMTSVLVGKDDELGMGQVYLYGQWLEAAEASTDDVDPGFSAPVGNIIEAAYVVTWPGEMNQNYAAWERVQTQVAQVEAAIKNYEEIVATFPYASRYEGEELTAPVDAAHAWCATTLETYKAKYEANSLTEEDGVLGEMMEQLMAIAEAINAAAQYDLSRHIGAVVNYWAGDDDEFEGVRDGILAIIEALPVAGQSALIEQVTLIETAIAELIEDYKNYAQYIEEDYAAIVEKCGAVTANINDLLAAAQEAAESLPVVTENTIGLQRTRIEGNTFGKLKTLVVDDVMVETIMGETTMAEIEAGKEATGSLMSLGVRNCTVQDNDGVLKVAAEQKEASEESFYGYRMTVPEGKYVQINKLVGSFLYDKNYNWQVAIVNNGVEVYNTGKLKFNNNYNNSGRCAGDSINVTREGVSGLSEASKAKNLNETVTTDEAYMIANCGWTEGNNLNEAVCNLTGEVEVKMYYFGKASLFAVKDLYVEATVTEDIVDAISNTTINNTINGALFNLAGQKVDNNFKGIVIKNGKKVMVK